jgi:hypothetical protein
MEKRAGNEVSNKEIQGKENKTKEQKQRSPGKSPAPELDGGTVKSCVNDAEPGFEARLIEGAHGHVTRKVAPQQGDLRVHPIKKFFAMTPEKQSA